MEDTDGLRPMRYRHVLREAALYDQRNVGDGAASHAVPRRVTVCGIPVGRLDDPQAEGAPPCPACADAGR